MLDPQPPPESSAKAAPPRKCGCKCLPQCKCDCPCQAHCICGKDEKGKVTSCTGVCGDKKARNLVVSIDGTSNQFGKQNTNVVELHSRILTDSEFEQLTFYAPGIGTYAPPNSTWRKSFKQWSANMLDLAVAWNFEHIIHEAYLWLADNYRDGDRIFLFGFSRGAYQVRTLAAMIDRVGLVHAGNIRSIPFAYEIYVQKLKGRDNSKDAEEMARHFKTTFSRNVKVHFLGAWDTVSSVGIVRGKTFPLTNYASHICIFRHALALDERRVKFLPEYVDGSSSVTIDTAKIPSGEEKLSNMAVSTRPSDGKTKSGVPNGNGEADQNVTTDERKQKEPGTGAKRKEDGAIHNVKEVWFAGTHCDIGGGIKPNLTLTLSGTPLLWMENEAAPAGLRLRPRNQTGGEWQWDDLKTDGPTESLVWIWWLLEVLFVKRLTYHEPPSWIWQLPGVFFFQFFANVAPLNWIWWLFEFFLYNRSQDTTRIPHLGQGRTIARGQTIHASVAFKADDYHPKASAPWFGTAKLDEAWSSLVGKGDTDDLSWVELWHEHLEMDLFDASFADRLVNELRTSLPSEEFPGRLNRLSFIALSDRGAKTIVELNFVNDLVTFLSSGEQGIQIASASCLCRLIDSNVGDSISNSVPLEPLKRMLSHESLSVRVASFECLSRLAVRPYDVDLLPHTSSGSESAQNLFVDDKILFSILDSMLGDEVPGNMPARAASCLARLTTDSRIRQVLVQRLFRRRDENTVVSNSLGENRSPNSILQKVMQRVKSWLAHLTANLVLQLCRAASHAYSAPLVRSSRIFSKRLFRRQVVGEENNDLPVASVGETESSQSDLQKVIRRVAELLDDPSTQRDGALSLAHFAESNATLTTEMIKKLVSLLCSTSNWKIARACIICLRCYAESVTVQRTLLDERFVDIMLNMLKPEASSAANLRNVSSFRTSANAPSRSSLSAATVTSRHIAARHISSFMNYELLKSEFRKAKASQYVVNLLVDDQAATRKVGEVCVSGIEDSDFHEDVQSTMRVVLKGPSHKQRFLILVALQNLARNTQKEFLHGELATFIFGIVVNTRERLGVRIQAVGALECAIITQRWGKYEGSIFETLGHDAVLKCVEMLEKVDENVMLMEDARVECGFDRQEDIGYGCVDQTSTADLGATMLRCLALNNSMLEHILDTKAIQAMAFVAEQNNDDILYSVALFIYWLSDDPRTRKIICDETGVVRRLVNIRDSNKRLMVRVQAAEALTSLAYYEDSVQLILDSGALRTLSLDINIGAPSENLNEKISLLEQNLHFLQNLAQHLEWVPGISQSLADALFKFFQVDYFVSTATRVLATVISQDHLCFADTAKMVATLVNIYDEDLGWSVRENVQKLFALYASHDDTRQRVTTQEVLKTLQQALKDSYSNVRGAGSSFFQKLFENDDTARMLVTTHDALQTLRDALTSDDEDICAAGVSVFRMLFESSDLRALVATNEMLQGVLDAVPTALQMDQSGATMSSFRMLLKDESFRETACAGSFIQDQVATRDSDFEWRVQLGSQRVLVALTELSQCVPFLLKTDAVPRALASDDNDVQVAGCALLQNLAPDDEARSAILEYDLIRRLAAIPDQQLEWAKKNVRDASRATLQELLKHVDVNTWLRNQDEFLQTQVAALVREEAEDATWIRVANGGNETGTIPDPGEVTECLDPPTTLVASDERTSPTLTPSDSDGQ